MKPLTIIFLFMFSFFSALGHPAIVHAENDLVVENVSINFKFAQSLTISATIPASDNLKSITLILNADDQQSRQVKIEIGKNNAIETTYDLQTGGFIPYSRIYYWFEAELKSGGIVTSPSYWFDYTDNRFTWKSNQSNLFNIYWVEGDATYGQSLQQVARSGLENATRLLPVAPIIPIDIYVYPDEASLQSVLSLGSQDWVNGHTFVGHNRIFVAESSPTSDLTDLERVIPHELMHILEYQMTGNNYKNAPAWLLEGLATEAELYPNPDHERILNDALSKNTLNDLTNLCSGFSQDVNQASLDYAHSASVVTYIRKNYGDQVILQMLTNSSSGVDCSRNVSTSLGISVQQLDEDWKNSVEAKSSLINSLSLPTLLWIAIPTILLIAGIFTLIRRHRTQKD